MPNNRSNGRRRRSYQSRKVNKRNVRQRFLIICEGKKTEKNYFNSFRVPKKVVGLGRDPYNVVQKAVDIKSGDDYDQVWCVFDRDDCTSELFNRAIEFARSNDIQIAYSNDSFELWFLLHYHYYNAAITRSDCCKKLSKLMEEEYEKACDKMYTKLLERQEDAIKNATRLLSQYDPQHPERDNPSTTVHQLVIELNKYIF